MTTLKKKPAKELPKLEIVPRHIHTGADSYDIVYDLRLAAINGETLWYNGQGYTSTRDAKRGIRAIIANTALAKVVMGEPTKDYSLAPPGAA